LIGCCNRLSFLSATGEIVCAQQLRDPIRQEEEDAAVADQTEVGGRRCAISSIALTGSSATWQPV